MKNLASTIREHRAVATIVDTGWAFLSRLRLRAALWVAGIALCTWAAIALAGLAWVPAVGVAFAAAAVSISKVAQRLDRPLCHGCGHDMTQVPLGHAGAICPSCGSLHQPRPRGSQWETMLAAADAGEEDVKA